MILHGGDLQVLDVIRRIAGEYVHTAWVLEFVIMALAWLILRHDGPVRAFFRFRMLGEFALLFAALCGVTLLCMAISGEGGAFFLIRIVAQGFLTAFYMIHFSAYRLKTKLLLWLSLTAAGMSIFHVAGQWSLLIGNAAASGAMGDGIRVAVHLLLIFVALWLKHFRFDEYLTVPKSGLWMIGVNIASVLLLYVVESVSFRESSQWLVITLLAAYTGTLIMLLATVQALYTMCREQQAIIDLQAEKQRYLSEQEQTRMTEAMLHDLRSIRHDLKNQYAYMQILLGEQRYTELETYFNDLLKALPAPLKLVDCGNHTVNTVLNMEFSKLRADRIAISHSLAVPSSLPFKDEDLCAILSNLLDNAAEECRRMMQEGAEKTDISLDIHPHQSYLIIQCGNPTTRTALTRKNGGLQTTKGDAELHGYGTQIIRKLAEKYNGYADYSLDNGRFVAQVMLDLEVEVDA